MKLQGESISAPKFDSLEQYRHHRGNAKPPLAYSLGSLALMLIAFGGSFAMWWQRHDTYFEVAGYAFLILAPLWYRVPVNVKSLLFRPAGATVTFRRRFAWLDIISCFIGYGLLLAASSMALWTLAHGL